MYWYYYLVLVSCIFFSFYFAIGAYPLFDNNEGLYASIAKYMVIHKDFIIPHVNNVIYIEKPPLLYWLMSLSFSLFGFTAFAARLVTASSAALICLALVYFGKKIRNFELGLVSAIIFASSIGVSIIARMVYFDMLFTLMIGGSLLCFFYWHNAIVCPTLSSRGEVRGIQKNLETGYESEQTQKIMDPADFAAGRQTPLVALRAGYIFCALAVLTKGLIALMLVGGSFGLFLLLQKNYRKFYQILDPVGITLFLIIALPWHIAATLKHQGFAWSYLIEEHFLRFLGQRQPCDYYSGPIYYYLPRIMIYIFPWSLYLPVIFWQYKNTLKHNYSVVSRHCEPYVFYKAWQSIKFFWIASQKTLAMTIFKASSDNYKLLSFCWCWFLVPLLFFSVSSAKANYYMIVGMPALAVIIGLNIKDLLSNPKIKIAFLCIATLIVPLVLLMVWYIKNHEYRLSSAAAGIYLSQQANKLPLYVYQDLEDISALFFYAPGNFKIIDTKSHDLYYGAKLPQYSKFFVAREDWRQESRNKPFYVVVAKKKLLDFKKCMRKTKLILLDKSSKLMVFIVTKA